MPIIARNRPELPWIALGIAQNFGTLACVRAYMGKHFVYFWADFDDFSFLGRFWWFFSFLGQFWWFFNLWCPGAFWMKFFHYWANFDDFFIFGQILMIFLLLMTGMKKRNCSWWMVTSWGDILFKLHLKFYYNMGSSGNLIINYSTDSLYSKSHSLNITISLHSLTRSISSQLSNYSSLYNIKYNYKKEGVMISTLKNVEIVLNKLSMYYL